MDKPLRRGNTYFARLIIPKARWADVGKAYGTPSGQCRERVATLQTTDRGQALQRLPSALAALRQQVDEKLHAARLPRLTTAWTPSWATRATDLRERFLGASDRPYLVIDDGDGSTPETYSARQDVTEEIMVDYRELEVTEGQTIAHQFLSMATDGGLSLADARDRWIAELERSGKIRRQTIEGHRAALRLLGDFLRAEDPARFPALEATMATDITRRLAGGYIEWRRGTVSAKTGRLVSDGTIHREVSSFMGLWRWVRRRGYGEAIPWEDQMAGSARGRPIAATAGDQEEDRSKRPYTIEEVVKLIRATGVDWAPKGGGFAPALWDAVRLGLLTGCRANELGSLLVGDLVEGGTAIRVRVGKTRNAARVVPLCEYAQRVVADRLASLDDRSPTAPLWPDLPAIGDDPRRGKTLSHRFGQARGRVVGEDALGVDFHSFRRTFAAYVRDAMQAGQGDIDPTLLGALMGHSEQTLALKVYAPGALAVNLRRAVEAMWSRGVPAAVKAALLETQGQRPPVVRLVPAPRPARRAASRRSMEMSK
jgi:integrase